MFFTSTSISKVFVLVLWEEVCLAKDAGGDFLSWARSQLLHAHSSSVEILPTGFRTRPLGSVGLLVTVSDSDSFI